MSCDDCHVTSYCVEVRLTGAENWQRSRLRFSEELEAVDHLVATLREPNHPSADARIAATSDPVNAKMTSTGLERVS